MCHSVLGTNGRNYDAIDMEREVLSSIAGKRKLFVYESERFWSQIKNAGYVDAPDITAIMPSILSPAMLSMQTDYTCPCIVRRILNFLQLAKKMDRQ